LLILFQATFLVFLAAATGAGIIPTGLRYHTGYFTQHGAPAMDEAFLTDLQYSKNPAGRHRIRPDAPAT
jgi:hypothetical protein